MLLVLLQALEVAVRVEPTLPDRLQEWMPHGQAHVIQQVFATAYGTPKVKRKTRR